MLLRKKKNKHGIYHKLILAFAMVGVAVTSFIFASPKTYAYVYNGDNNTVVSENLLNPSLVHFNTGNTQIDLAYYDKGTYTLSWTFVSASKSWGSSQWQALDSGNNAFITQNISLNKLTFTLSERKQIKFFANTNMSGVVFMLNKGSTVLTYEPYGVNINLYDVGVPKDALSVFSQYDIFHSGTPKTRDNVSSVVTHNYDGSISEFANYSLMLSAKAGNNTITSFDVYLKKPYPVNTLSFLTNISDGGSGRGSSYISSITLDNKFVITNVADEFFKYLYYDNFEENTQISKITYNLAYTDLGIAVTPRYVLDEGLNITIRFTGSSLIDKYYQVGYENGKYDGYDEFYYQGLDDGYYDGYNDGMRENHDTVYNQGYTAGDTAGYNRGIRCRFRKL